MEHQSGSVKPNIIIIRGGIGHEDRYRTKKDVMDELKWAPNINAEAIGVAVKKKS